MFTYCFYLQPSLACSVNVYTEEAPFFFFEFGYFFTCEQLLTCLILQSRMPVLFITSLTQSAGYEMASLTVVFWRL